jgi:tetratricopeptide (TPR) repeat protein
LQQTKRFAIVIFFLFYSYQLFSQNFFVENKLSTYANESNDIVTIFLELEKEIKPSLNVENYLHKIDSVAEALNCEFENCATIQDSIKIINENLFYKQQLFFKNECEFISDILVRHCGNCASFSAYYLAVAERLGIKNLYPVLAPTHIFLRYDYNGTKINIETTQKGENYSDEWYRNYFGVSEKILLSDTYFRNLSQKEFIAVLINNRGNEFLRMRKTEEAISDFNTALAIFPTLAEVYFGLAHYYSGLGDKKKAIEQYNKVLENNPDFANAYCNRGLLYEETGVFDNAINDYNTALKLNPNFAEVYYNRGVAYTRQGNYSQAINDFTTALKIKPDYADAYYNRGCAKNLGSSDILAIIEKKLKFCF